MKFDPADYRTSLRVLLVLASSSAPMEYYLFHPIAVSHPSMNAVFLALQDLYLYTTTKYLVKVGH